MHKKILKHITEQLLSEKVQMIAVYVLTVVIITAVLTSKHYLFQSIIDNGLSKKNIIATKKIEVVDVEKTDQRKREMARRVEPILTPFHDDHIINNYDNLISSISIIRAKDDSFLTKERELQKIIDITDKKDAATLDFLLRTTDQSFQKISEYGLKTLAKSLDMGVSEKSINQDIDKFLSENTSDVLSTHQSEAVCLLVKQIVLPNMIVDEMATEVAKQNAMNSVRPIVVTFEKGEQIVFEGEYVSRLKKDALKKAGYTVSELNLSGVLGLFALVLMVSYCLYFYLKNLEDKYKTLPYILMLSLLSILMTVIAVSLPADTSVYLMPFAAYTIILSIFISLQISFLASVLLLLIIGIALGYSIDIIATFAMSIMIATFAVGKLNFLRRMNLAQVGIFVCATQAYMIFAIYVMNSNIYSVGFVTDITAGIISGLLSGVIALGLIPLFEGMFKIITPYGLAELADHNQGLLKRLQFEAPGTYHHSLMVSNLCEAAAEAVGANPILARVGAFYHDIGKLKRPLFFVENQSYFSIENPHEKLNPRLSKMIITAHPKDGLDLAKEYGLPAVRHKFIIQHHG
ncbi:MAG: HDIG domain-containing protein, partial [Candidatus Gastranaerophilales bacterium]|nr:HDIG domain-containing protein [Candidatus Gastranaerophilales bacterium]